MNIWLAALLFWIKTLALLAIHHQLIHCTPCSHVRISSRFFFHLLRILFRHFNCFATFFFLSINFFCFFSLTIKQYETIFVMEKKTAKFALKKWQRLPNALFSLWPEVPLTWRLFYAVHIAHIHTEWIQRKKNCSATKRNARNNFNCKLSIANALDASKTVSPSTFRLHNNLLCINRQVIICDKYGNYPKQTKRC